LQIARQHDQVAVHTVRGHPIEPAVLEVEVGEMEYLHVEFRGRCASVDCWHLFAGARRRLAVGPERGRPMEEEASAQSIIAGAAGAMRLKLHSLLAER
jgi:hypothetical protein